MKIEIIDEIEFLRKTKNYTLEINNKRITAEKIWTIDDINDEYACDYEIENEEELTEDEIDEVNGFLGEAE